MRQEVPLAAGRRKQFVLAVDLGTSGCKCALVGLDGVVYKWSSRSTTLHIVDRVGAEQAPEDWWSIPFSRRCDTGRMLRAQTGGPHRRCHVPVHLHCELLQIKEPQGSRGGRWVKL